MAEVQVRLLDDSLKPRWVALTKSIGGLGNFKQLKMASGTLTAGVTSAYAFAWQNPESVQIVVLKVIVKITGAGGAAGTLDIGTAATATTNSENLLDSISHNATVIYTNDVNGGAAGKGAQLMDASGGATSWITAQIMVADASSLVGTWYILYVPLT